MSEASVFSLLVGPHYLTAISFRPDGQFGDPFNTIISDITITCTTTAASHSELSSCFDDNLGPDQTIVHDGPLPLSSADIGPPGGPKEFDITINLQTPFLYDPASGNLLFEIKKYSTEPTETFDTDSSLHRLYNDNADDADTPCANAQGDEGPGLVTQYTFVPVPGACCIPASGTCEVLTLTDCVATDGTWMGPETNCDDADFNDNPDICENTCQGDVDGDGEVGIVDFLIVLGNWGTCQ